MKNNRKNMETVDTNKENKKDIKEEENKTIQTVFFPTPFFLIL